MDMLRTFCRCKIHHATVTHLRLGYVGSMTIPADMMKLLDIREGEQVDVVNMNNGQRWTTYAIQGKRGEYCLNGAAARLGLVGDTLIIIVYAQLNEDEMRRHRMKVALLGPKNKLLRIKS